MADLWTPATSGRYRRSVPKRHVPIEDIAPRRLVEFLASEYPVLRRRTDLLCLAVHVLLTPHHDDRGAVPMPRDLVGNIVGELHRARQHNFRSGKRLREFANALQRASHSTFDVEVLPAVPEENLSRHVLVRRVPDEVVALVAEAATVLAREDVVCVRPTGPVRADDTEAQRRRQELIDRLPPSDDAPDLSRTLQDYLNCLVPQVFQKLRDPELLLGAGVYAAERFPGETERVKTTLRTLQQIAVQPMPIYKTTPKTPRLYAVGRNVTSLPSAVRHHLTEQLGYIEFDLAHAQLAVNAWLWRAGGVLERLADEGYRLWDDLMAHVGVDPYELSESAPEQYSSFKRAIKVVVHGLSFGMAKKNLVTFGRLVQSDDEEAEKEDAEVADRQKVVENATGRPYREVGKRLLKHPVLHEMWRARQVQLRRLYGGLPVVDAFKRRLLAASPEEARSVLACVAQSGELWLLKPVIEAALAERGKKRPAFHIVWWQHDGFTVSVSKRGDEGRIKRMLTRLVDDKAKQHRIPTRLVVEVDPCTS